MKFILGGDFICIQPTYRMSSEQSVSKHRFGLNNTFLGQFIQATMHRSLHAIGAVSSEIICMARISSSEMVVNRFNSGASRGHSSRSRLVFELVKESTNFGIPKNVLFMHKGSEFLPSQVEHQNESPYNLLN